MTEEWKTGSRFDPAATRPKPGPCSRETKRCAAATNYHANTPECCRTLLMEVLAHWTEVADELGITWWADYGTLLGAVRNGGLIPHDKDLDIGMLGEDWDRLLAWRESELPWQRLGGSFRQQMSRNLDGYFWIHKEPRAPKANSARYEFTGGHSLKIISSPKNWNNLDVFPWYVDEPTGRYYRKRYISIDRYKGRDFPIDKLLPLKTLPFDGIEIPVPNDYLWFVRHRYGRHWETPVRANNDGIRR
jgi:phosphorylcholine metabolism protein LicD